MHVAQLRSDICVVEPVEHLAVRLERRGHGAVRVDYFAAHGLGVVRQLEIPKAVPGKPRHALFALFRVAIFVFLNLPAVAGIEIQRAVRVYFLAASDGYIRAVNRCRNNRVAGNILAHVIYRNFAEVKELYGLYHALHSVRRAVLNEKFRLVRRGFDNILKAAVRRQLVRKAHVVNLTEIYVIFDYAALFPFKAFIGNKSIFFAAFILGVDFIAELYVAVFCEPLGAALLLGEPAAAENDADIIFAVNNKFGYVISHGVCAVRQLV